ncbi:hypothetical protein PybrP1_000910 [[Pythium] brassicae (nom. inval.)]|nr:hypothetical protein PybrP1_000910 [[Pythium] brassicae (nom. inval.)]
MEEIETLYFRLHAQLLCSFTRLLTRKSRLRLEALLFALATLLLLLLALLHASFVRASAADCLAPLLRAQPAAGDLLRVQIVGGDGAVDASFVFAAQRAMLVLVELPPSPDASDTGAQRVWSAVPTLRLPRESVCLNLRGVGANRVWSLVRDRVVGYNTIVLNLLARAFGGKGFVYCEALRSTWLLFAVFKFKVAHTILFLFFILTALVAFVLTETQKRMITFSELFQNRSQLQIPFANLVLVYFAQSLLFVPVLVGMLFFLFELYKDRFMAFAVMSLVWVGESFSVISVRSRLAQVYFPPLFFCLFAGLHVYVFSFPLGFTHIATAATAVLLALLMLFFWNDLEIPALRRGQVCVHTPREPLLVSY